MRRARLALPFVVLAAVVLTVIWDHRASSATRSSEAPATAVDPVCGMNVGANLSHDHEATTYYFCADRCRDRFIADPQRYTTLVCLVCKVEDIHTVVPEDAPAAVWSGKSYHFCTEAHRVQFRADPAAYFMHSMWGIPSWLYYLSIAVVLVLSFGVFEWSARTTAHKPADRSLTAQFLARTSRPRFDLLTLPGLRKLIVHPATRFVLRAILVILFVTIIAAGLFGNQLPAKNIAPILTWTIWWGGLIVIILYAGAAWCYVCPWQAIAEWAEGLRLWGTKKEGLSLGLAWPKALRNVWPAIVLFIALTWIELGFGVTYNPRATAYLALGITALAFVSAFVFDRASFCRYGCFVGRIIGLYSLFSPVEVRTKDLGACRTCGTKSCFKGNDQGDPCPTFQYLPGMESSAHCITCLECVKTCEKDNVGLWLRPWASDLTPIYRPSKDEAALALILLALTAFHGFTMTGAWQETLTWLQNASGLNYTAAFTVAMAFLTVAPIAIYALLVYGSWHAGGRDHITYGAYFTHYAYALLPIALFYHLAHNSEHLFFESQNVIPLLSDPFGYGWDLWGTASLTMKPLLTLPTLWLVQVALVLIGHVFSLYVAQRVAGGIFPTKKAVFTSQLPMLVAMILFSITSLWLLKQPMEMRISAM